MGSTKKVKMAGRFGARYGVKIRQRLVAVETEQKKKHICPKCEQKKVKRTAPGIFVCRKCGAKFTGGAYVPVTSAGSIVSKMVQQKQFMPYMKELIETGKPEEEQEESGESTKGKEKPKRKSVEKQHAKEKGSKGKEHKAKQAEEVPAGTEELLDEEQAEEESEEK